MNPRGDLIFKLECGCTSLKCSNAAGSYAIEIEHREAWLIANGRYALWSNAMWAVKRALDPLRIMNPGKMLQAPA